MIQLDIPYRSQWDKEEANHYGPDCGPTCVSMLLNYHEIPSTTNGIYADNFPGKTGFTNFNDLIGVFDKANIGSTYQQASTKGEALHRLKRHIDAGEQMIALVKYSAWRTHFPFTAQLFDGGHFVVITGYDEHHIYMHDPLFGLWVSTWRGKHFKMSNDLFCAGWNSFGTNNPNWAYILVDTKAVVIEEETEEETTGTAPVTNPEVTNPTEGEEEQEEETSNSGSASEGGEQEGENEETSTPEGAVEGPIMNDVNRRIRALAAYRWAEEPDFNDEDALAPWLEHLGDWGLTYTEHTVKSGENYSYLASHYYDGHYRWPAIRVYNEFTHSNLWVGQTLLIPDLGTGNGHLTTSLPSDTVAGYRSLDSDESMNPQNEAVDYNAYWDDSIQLGYVEPEGE